MHQPHPVGHKQTQPARRPDPQDFLTSAYLLTSKDRFLTRPEISQFVAYMTGALRVLCAVDV